MYNLRSRLQRVNYRTLHGLPDSDMSARKHTEHSESERDTEESQVLSEQDHEGHEEIPDETAEELEALIAKQESTLDDARQKVKLVALKQKLKELEKETLAEQLKLARATGTSKNGSKVPKNFGSKHKEVSSRDLREFEELSHKVEKRLSKMGLSSSASAAAADESTSSEESDDDSSSTERSSRKKRGKRNLKSGKTAKIATRVVRRQLWPHSELSMGYVSKNVSYDELTLEEFVAGYSAILLLPQVSSHERKHRTEHLGALMYLASIYEWPAVRSFHAAVLSEIERGRLNWEDSFLHLENRTLAGLHKKTKEQKRPTPSSSNAVLFCRDYQKGSCSHSKDHYAMLKGEKKWLCHICAACWVKDKAKRMHSEYADDCPNKPKE